MHPILQQVRDFADRSHGEQTRKYTPDRYIVHPERVMHTCAQYTDSVPVLAAALLHDVLEDTPVSEAGLHDFLLTVMSPEESTHTVQLVVDLTDVFTREAYPQWNRRKRKEKEVERMGRISAEAQTVKYADILDNCHEIVAEDPNFAPRFLYECKALLQVMKTGHAGLRQQARDAVFGGLSVLRRA